MSKYDALQKYLKSQAASHVPMTFSEIERVIGSKLPASAHEHSAWWANNVGTHVQAKAWIEAGYETEQVDRQSQQIVFKRSAGSLRAVGMADAPREFEPAPDNGEKKPRRHPLFGAMKGTFTIEPGWDLTRPALDPDELAEWEANLERKADIINRGPSGGRK